MASSLERQEILTYIGDPAVVDQELQQFRRAARVLSSKQKRMIDLYDKQWIAVFRGRVRVHTQTLASLMAEVTERGLPREHVIVRFIDSDQHAMVL